MTPNRHSYKRYKYDNMFKNSNFKFTNKGWIRIILYFKGKGAKRWRPCCSVHTTLLMHVYNVNAFCLFAEFKNLMTSEWTDCPSPVHPYRLIPCTSNEKRDTEICSSPVFIIFPMHPHFRDDNYDMLPSPYCKKWLLVSFQISIEALPYMS